MTLPQRISEDLSRRILDLELVASEALDLARRLQSDADVYRMMLSETLSLLQAQQTEAAATRRALALQVGALKDEIQRYTRSRMPALSVADGWVQ